MTDQPAIPPIAKGCRWHDTNTDQIKVFDGKKWGPCYRVLLKRYMALEADIEIDNSLRKSGKTAARTYPGLSDADKAELDVLSSEVADFITGDAQE